MRSVEATAITYDGLAGLLNFVGTDLLVIDAEGHDCKILESMINHCQAQGNLSAWPNVIQFETMGHSDQVEGPFSEWAMVECLKSHGYLVVSRCYGNNIQLVRMAALEAEPRIQKWLDSLCCGFCQRIGRDCLPFHWQPESRSGAACANCQDLCEKFGSGLWCWYKLPCETTLVSLGN